MSEHEHLEEDEDGVEILHVMELGPSEPRPPREVRHERNRPLPFRVREGCFEEDVLILENIEIPWEDISLLSLAIIEWEVKAAEGPQTMVQKMIGKSLMGREEEKGAGKGRQTSDIYILDIFVEGYDQAFRVDSANLNYRQFLDEIGYISLHNFYKFIVKLCRGAVNARVDPSIVAFLARKRHEIRRYGATYDFELEVQNFLNNLDSMIPQADLDLSRDSWMDDWEDW